MPDPKKDLRSVTRTTLHDQLANVLRGEIGESYQPGDKLEAESKLAKRFGVSLPTVREALSTLAHEGLVIRKHGSGTYVADGGADKHVAVLIELDISHPRTSYFYLRTTQQLRLYFEKKGIRAQLYVGHAQPEEATPSGLTCREFLEDLKANRLSGVAAVAVNPHSHWMDQLRDRNVPIVGGQSGFDGGVGIDYAALVKDGVTELLKNGRKRLMLLGGEGSKEFRAILKKRGVPVREKWMRHPKHPSILGAGYEEFVAGWNAHDEKPDGLLCTDDMLMQDAVPAILSLGVDVPGNLYVVSHANKGGMAPLPFPATLLQFDPDEYAGTLARILEQLLSGKKPKRTASALAPRRVKARRAAVAR